ncbi:sulfotransferase 6B1 [Alligator mississippiensis]|uniref:Sulfotransferase n=1 Tax=Alligator mississippiensis TaxID=8496 RepID=A0A151NIY3_ALLMI|nr:sulfotransferase 6B1 [Alligator mississippiensis]KYO36720.1 sulfotransferase 6B1-like [Alligator mississippiensis]
MSTQSQADLIHMFKGIPFTTRSSLELLKSLDTFDAREDDVLLVSYPKSGTHWLAQIIMQLYTNQVTLTSPIEFGDILKLEELKNLSSRRIIPTHLDYNMLPMNFKNKGCKTIYIIRNPKDTAVSMYHYYKDNPYLPTIDKWTTFLELFLKGDVVCGSWFEHFLSWEKHRNDENILFLFYEDMKKDLPKTVKKIGVFLGINISDSEIREVCKKSSFSEMKTNIEKENVDPNHTVCALTSDKKLIFRKGTVGDWKNHFTPKQNKLFEEMFSNKMKYSDLAKCITYEF